MGEDREEKVWLRFGVLLGTSGQRYAVPESRSAHHHQPMDRGLATVGPRRAAMSHSKGLLDAGLIEGPFPPSG